MSFDDTKDIFERFLPFRNWEWTEGYFRMESASRVQIAVETVWIHFTQMFFEKAWIHFSSNTDAELATRHHKKIFASETEAEPLDLVAVLSLLHNESARRKNLLNLFSYNWSKTRQLLFEIVMESNPVNDFENKKLIIFC